MRPSTFFAVTCFLVLCQYLYMMQSGDYIISADMIQSYCKIDLEEFNMLMKIAIFPQQITINIIRKLIFDPRLYSPKVNFIIAFVYYF